ncbi:hypothetical protein ABLE91_10175 [Aquabacter sp. CN5-332]|uniref:hypothetical protein n=1 Tax=Aquabacter sp. CN5-332 TaxID=3156608 RepID=UPI0032B460AC
MMRLCVMAVAMLCLPACAPEEAKPVAAQQGYDLALRRCQSLALQKLPNISANIMVAPGIYSNNGMACRPDAVWGASCAPRPNWLPPTGGDPNASGEARAVLVGACMRDAGFTGPVF